MHLYRDSRRLKTIASFNLFKADLTDQVNKRDKFKKIDRITPLLPIQDSYTLEYYRHNGLVKSVNCKSRVERITILLDLYTSWIEDSIFLYLVPLQKIEMAPTQNFYSGHVLME